MRRVTPSLLLAVALSACATTTGPSIRTVGEPLTEVAEPGVRIVSPFLVQPYRLLLDRSPTFKTALTAAMRGRDRAIIIGYEDDLRTQYHRLFPAGDNVARVYPVAATGDVREAVVIALGTGAIEAAAMSLGYDRDLLVGDLALIIGHEIYGHILPVWSGQGECSDNPRIGKETVGCAIDRENVIRRDLGVAARPDHATVDLGFICVARPGTCVSGGDGP